MEEDFRSCYDLVVDYVVRAELESLNHPFIVICHDRSTGATSYSGPYWCGLAALEAAEHERIAESQGCGSDPSPVEFSVAPLTPGLDPQR